MKVAIFGSRGFLGSRIANAAVLRGWSVNHIGSSTSNAKELVGESDAVIHSVGSFMPDKRYKQLVNEPVSLCNIAQLASMKLGLSSGNPLSRESFQELNFASLKSAADDVRATHFNNSQSDTRFPFVFISATDWGLADPEYIRSKRTAEKYLEGLDFLRPVFLRPGFISPDMPHSCNQITPRNLLDRFLDFTESPYRVNVDAVAEAACDAVEDSSISGPVEAEVLRMFEDM